jgi:alpha-L-arabinofuranosidase
MRWTTLVAGGMVALFGIAGFSRAAEPVALTVHVDKTAKTIDKRIYGQFLEHIFNSVHGGLWGDQVLNGSLSLRINPRPPATVQTAPPMYWEFFGAQGTVKNDTDRALSPDSSVHIESTDAQNISGIRQGKIALTKGEKYTLAIYFRGKGKCSIAVNDGGTVFLGQAIPIDFADWTRVPIEFTVNQSADAADLQILLHGAGTVNVDQVSLFSASALATGGYRPDLLKAVTDLQPTTIRWPGGSFANKYIWENGIGPREKRAPHPAEQWNDRDPYEFGTDEFMGLCEKIGAEPIIVLNTARGVENGLQWLEYCMGDASTEFGKKRAANGHPAPYALKTIEIDNETWLLMKEPQYLDMVSKFARAIRAKYPQLKLSVCGSYAYDTGPGEGDPSNAGWDQKILDSQAKNFDILSPHYYNGLLSQHKPDFVEDPRNYEKFLAGRGEMIKKSANPNIKIYVSEWNLTYGQWGNDWRVGLYAGGILNAFERQGDSVIMSCPALFMRKIGVTKSWDNALINFNEKSWFPAANYVVMKLWREAYAPNLLAVDGPDHPFNVVATRSQDGKTVFLKIVNPEGTPYPAAVTLLGGSAPPVAAGMQVIAPGAQDAKNSIEQPDRIAPQTGLTAIDQGVVKFTMPGYSAAVVRISQ